MSALNLEACWVSIKGIKAGLNPSQFTILKELSLLQEYPFIRAFVRHFVRKTHSCCGLLSELRYFILFQLLSHFTKRSLNLFFFPFSLKLPRIKGSLFTDKENQVKPIRFILCFIYIVNLWNPMHSYCILWLN